MTLFLQQQIRRTIKGFCKSGVQVQGKDLLDRHNRRVIVVKVSVIVVYRYKGVYLLDRHNRRVKVVTEGQCQA